MEGEKRKRKLENEEENEEEKMEEFFSLIKRTKDVRDRLYNKEKTEKKIVGERERSIWKPTFQPEDFIEMGKSSIVSVSASHASPSEKEFLEKKQDLQEATPLAPTPQDNEIEEKDKASEHLDLNLSL